MLFRSSLAALCLSLTATIGSSTAAAPSLEGDIYGIELCPQSVCGAAVFMFEYEGLVDGRLRNGWGWIAVTHDDLPTSLGSSAFIGAGVGEIYVGWRKYQVSIGGGLLSLSKRDVFEVVLFTDICNRFGQCAQHTFGGWLSHETLIPRIGGSLMSD